MTMKPMPALLLAFVVASSPAISAPQVSLLRTPGGGIQPQVVVGEDGVTHLIYFAGAPEGGDVFYAKAVSGSEAFSKPVRVNSRANVAMAAGTIRGAQMAVGRNGRVHVVWNGNGKLLTGSHEKAPLFYARLNDAGTAFEPERNVITTAYGLDGGSSVAADNAGNVYVVWHAQPGGQRGSEATRGVFVAKSSDDGKTFAPERQVNPTTSGVCPCCGLKAFAGPGGTVAVLYRLAQGGMNRDSSLLLSRDGGRKFDVVVTESWKVGSCPMSSSSLNAAKSGMLAAWETAGKVRGVLVDATASKVQMSFAPEGEGKRKHPVIVPNSRGEVLMAWAEGTAWKKGGAVAWQVFDADGKPTAEKGTRDGLPVWGLATAFAKPDGSFVVVY